MIKLSLTTGLLAGMSMVSLSACAVGADDDARARKMMLEAVNHRYHWNDGFKGFSADFAVTREGKTVRGTVKVDATKPRGAVTVTCGDEDIKKLVNDTIASTVTHTRATKFEQAFGSSTFSIVSEDPHGGTKIAVHEHGFFKDFTVKDGHVIENHGGHGSMSSEVKVQEVVWLADCGKTLPKSYVFTIKTGDREQKGMNMERWREVDGVWLPAHWHLVRTESSSAPVESDISLENIKVD